MIYTFPVIADTRHILPSMDRTLSEVESAFRQMTNEAIRLSYRGTIATLTLEASRPMTQQEIDLYRAQAAAVIGKQFPNAGVEVGPAQV